MKTAEIFPVTSRLPHGYGWKWRCLETKDECKSIFALFYECVEDARKHGHEVELTRPPGCLAPGTASTTG